MQTDDDWRLLINRKLVRNNRRDQQEVMKGWLTAHNFDAAQRIEE